MIVAVPWRHVRSLFAEDLLARCRRWQMSNGSSRRRSRPFTFGSIGRSPLCRHAVLVGRLSQWVFANQCALVVAGVVVQASTCE